MKTISIHAILITDGVNYIIHGNNETTPSDLFKTVAGGDNPVWAFDPSSEAVHYIKIDVTVPEYETPENHPDRMALTLNDCKLS